MCIRDSIKIKEAYGLTKAYTAQQLTDEGATDQRELETQGLSLIHISEPTRPY